MDKRKASEYSPRPGDLPVKELLAWAEPLREAGWTVYFKFTCAWCQERCTLEKPNHLYSDGECFQCGKTTIIDVGGVLLKKGE